MPEEIECDLSTEDAVIIAADQSLIGSYAWVQLSPRKAAYIKNPHFNGGWHILKEFDIKKISFQSNSSKSTLRATMVEEGEWDIDLAVPVEEWGPYQGICWQAFDSVFPEV